MSPFGMQQLAAMAQGVTISFACCLEVLKMFFLNWKGVPPQKCHVWKMLQNDKQLSVTDYQIKWEICDDKPLDFASLSIIFRHLQDGKAV